jgi:Cullin family/Cullin protein neddylation domain
LEQNIQPEIYHNWLTEFLADWNVNHQQHHDDDHHDTTTTSGTTTTNINNNNNKKCTTQGAAADRSILQAIWYMWQDLPNVLDETQLQNDLETYWSNHQQQQQLHQQYPNPSSSSTSINNNSNNTNHTSSRMGYVYDIFQRCHRYDPWLPVAWLQHIVDTQLYQPQATQLSNDICAALLSEGIESIAKLSSLSSSDQDNTANNNNNNNMVYQWWTLHTRYNAVDAAQRLQNFAKQAATNRSIADLLQFQHYFGLLLQMLPGAVAAVPTKSIYENVVTEEMAETLAKYMDGILKSTKKLDLQPKDWLHKVIVGVFVPLSSKDVFEAFYKKDLAKRLLWNRVVSMDVEKQVCSMLKAECGSGYSSKIEGMFQDIENSRETMLVYQQQQQQQPPSGGSSSTTDAAATFEVQVLTTGYWPLYPEYPNLILPRFLQDHQDHFVEFYKSKYQGRRVAWKYALGHCVIKTRGFAKPYELVLSLTQAIVLIQFGDSSSSVAGNTNNTRTLPELMKLTGLEDREEMERILQSLSLGKDGTRILRKMDHPGEGSSSSSSSAAASAVAVASKPKRVVSDQDTFCINESFSNKALRIRITNIMTKETKQERDTTVAAVSRDRLYLIDAAIVRILKSRKSLLHQALVPQVLEHLKFPAKIPDIKLRIESLIEREYVERDGQDRNRYNYLA